MKVKLKGKTVSLSNELGRGGEAVVYHHDGQAVKIYHKNQANLLAARMKKVEEFPKNLPANVSCPQDIVYDMGGSPIGFAMPFFKGQDIRLTTKRSWRDGIMSQGETTRLMVNVINTLRGVHNANAVFGDFNYSNVLFKDIDCWFIDTDAIQFGSHLCIVGHEHFLDPRLYNVDLSQQQVFTPLTDDYSFSVMLFMALLYVHPYGGNHPNHKTMLRRAEARHSIMRDDVKYPKKAIPFDTLPDELIHYFKGMFDQDKREAFDAQMLAGIQWTTCTCGTEHARHSCPVCKVAVYKPAVTSHGKCRVQVLFETKGRILVSAMQHGLKYVYEEDGKTYREDGTVVLSRKRRPNMRFTIAGNSTWVGHEKNVVEIRNESVANRKSTGILGGLPIFDTHISHAYGTHDSTLVDMKTGNRIGNILKDRTWFKVGSTFGFGFYQVGAITQYFVFEVGKTGVREIDLPDIQGRVLDVAAYFDDNYVLFCLSTEENGKNRNFMYLVRKNGTLKASAEGTSDDRIFESVRGKCVLQGRLLSTTEDGLVSLKVENGTISEGTVFTETEPFVSADMDIHAGNDGSIYIVHPKRIEKLTMS